MKLIILAGGKGTRLSEETIVKPKPLVLVGGKPIIWHIMKMYSVHGINDFIICCGYKGYVIKEYFTNYFLHQSDVTVDMATNSIEFHRKRAENWRITLIDTGDESMTGGRLKRVSDYLDDDFCFTYGDGLSDVDITKTIKFHREHGRLATLTGVFPPGRFGAIKLNGKQISSFEEKPRGDGSLINGGFFVLKKEVLKYIKDDGTVWEQEPLKKLADDEELMCYKHEGFWQPMDTLRDKNYLEELWNKQQAPWNTWS